MVQSQLSNISITKFVDYFANASHVGMSDDFHIMDVSIKDSQDSCSSFQNGCIYGHLLCPGACKVVRKSF